MNTTIEGSKFEQIACKYLESKSYEILERNYHARPFGEIDIVAKLDDVIVFVEVKGRSNHKFGSGENAVTAAKRKKVIKSCMQWLVENDKSNDWQIDVIAIDKLHEYGKKVIKLKHYKNCITQLDFESSHYDDR